VGFCTTNRNKFSVYFDIFQGIMDGDEFSIILEGAIASGFIVEGDVLVLDNATTHDGLMETQRVSLPRIPGNIASLRPPAIR
jgi:hypothetical protein